MRAFVVGVMTDAATRDRPPSTLVRAHHLGPIAYKRGVAEFRAEYAASTVVAERRAGLLAEVVGALRTRGVRVALVKGISFVGTIYPDPAERPMNDIDLLI